MIFVLSSTSSTNTQRVCTFEDFLNMLLNWFGLLGLTNDFEQIIIG
jgi:hypothetical protein